MSHALAKLRAHFDDPLLVAAGRAMTLAKRARDLAPSVAAAIVGLDRVFNHAPRFDARTAARPVWRSSLFIGASDSSSSHPIHEPLGSSCAYARTA
jgi:DNA-binding transcriptional LysR family regulator